MPLFKTLGWLGNFLVFNISLNIKLHNQVFIRLKTIACAFYSSSRHGSTEGPLFILSIPHILNSLHPTTRQGKKNHFFRKDLVSKRGLTTGLIQRRKCQSVDVKTANQQVVMPGGHIKYQTSQAQMLSEKDQQNGGGG